MDAFLRELGSLLPPGSLLTEAADREAYGHDWSSIRRGMPMAVALPKTPAEVQQIVRLAAASGVAIVPSGGRTGLSGGAAAAPSELVLSTERMNRIIGFDPHGRSLTVESGVSTQALQEAARSHGLFYPVDFASRGSSRIGGNVATNAGGIRVLRYGMTRDWVLGLKVVTGTGDLLDLNRGLVKNATGYDLRHLFIGSEGTLGIVVEATIGLAGPPPPQQVMLLALRSRADLMAVFALLQSRLSLSAFECLDDRALAHVVAAGGRKPFASDAPMYVLAEYDMDEDAALGAFEAVSDAGLVVDAVIAGSDTQAAALWRLREGITESLAHHRPYKNDISVRVADVPAFMDAASELFADAYGDFDVVWFGHVGDGNLHVSIVPPAGMDRDSFNTACERVTELLGAVLSRFGGSISAEHGIGLLKKPYLLHSRAAEEIALMRGIKQVFDPAGILNPGKIFDPV